MNQAKFQNFTRKLQKLYELSGIPLCLCDDKGELLLIIPSGLGMAPLKEYLSAFIASFQQENHNSDKPMIKITKFHSFIGLMQLSADCYLMVGPLPSSRLKQAEIWDAYSHIFSPDALLDLCQSLTRTPIYTYRKFICALSLIAELCTNKHISYEEIAIMNPPLVPDVEKGHNSTPSFEKPVYYTDILHYENGICDAVAAGNMHLLEERFMNPTHYPVSGTHIKPLMREKYSSISLIFLVVRAAIQGGMPREAAFSLGDIYCAKIDRATSFGEVETLTYKMMRNFCSKVADTKVGNGASPIVRKCQNYIDEHLHEEIRLNDLANICNVSSRSITSHFKNALNMSVPEYITRERLRESRYLLTHTDFSISEISHHFRFSSQSYFTLVFRKAFGCTPQQYRRNTIHV